MVPDRNDAQAIGARVSARPDPERVWLQCMIAALGGLASLDVKPGARKWGEVNAELAKDAADLADAAVAEWRKRIPT